MALGGSQLSWDEATPAGSESVALGDDRIRSFKTAMRNAFDSEHFFASSGSTGGGHRQGSARAFWGPQSQASTSGDSYSNGRMMITSNTTRLLSVASTLEGGGSGLSTFMLGAGPLTPSFGSWLPVSYASKNDQTKCIAMESGLTKQSGAALPGGATIDITFPTAFDSPPLMFFHAARAGDGYLTSHINFNLATITASGFTGAMCEDANGGGVAGYSNASLWWFAIGTRSL